MNVQDQILLNSWVSYIKKSSESNEEIVNWAVSKLSGAKCNPVILPIVLRMVSERVS
jgi:hypothetical protein